MQDAWRAYLELALGLTEASRRKAEKVARDLLDKGGATASQAQSIVEELVNTSRTNRAELTKLVRSEVERSLGRLGLATAEEVSQLAARVRELERQLRVAESAAGAQGSGTEAAAEAAAPPAAAPARSPAKVAKKTTAKKALAKKAPAKKATKQASKKAAGGGAA
jgi:polyhydroxyalkanoate synthesis regulator phasin